MIKARAADTLPVLTYWTRLPGCIAFVGVSVGVCAAKSVLWMLPRGNPASSIYIDVLLLLTVIAAAAGVLCRRAWIRTLLFAVCGAALFAGAEMDIGNFYKKMEGIAERGQIFTLRMRITSPVAEARYGNKFRAKVINSDNAEVSAALTGRNLQCVSRGDVPPYGVITVQGRYAAPRQAAGPFGFDQRDHFAVNNIHGSFNISRILGDGGMFSDQHLTNSLSTDNISHALRNHVHTVIALTSSPNARGIFHAAVLGEKEYLPDELTALFRRSGIIHLLAISGFHAALLYSAVFAALGLLALPAKTRTLASLAALWGYLFFIGFIPSLFRATVMVTFFCASMLFQRKNHVVHSLGMSGALWLFTSPHSLFAPGFQLSFAATAGIVVMQPVFNVLTKAAVDGIHSKIVGFLAGRILSPFWVSVAGFAATAPSLLYHFGSLSLYGIFFNLIAIPLMSAAMWVFFAAVALSPVAFLSNLAIWCSETILNIMIYFAAWSDHISISEIVVPRITSLQIAVMVVFMIGLCGIRRDLRSSYVIRVGGASALLIAVSSLYLSITAKTETLKFNRNTASAEVIVHKNNTAWIAANGRPRDIRALREREIEPLLSRLKIKEIPLFIINENSEPEAHEFAFTTGFSPKIIAIRNGVNERYNDDGYVKLDHKLFIPPDRSCSLNVLSFRGGQ